MSSSVPVFRKLERRNTMKWCDRTEAEPYRLQISSCSTRESLKLLIPRVVGGQYQPKSVTPLGSTEGSRGTRTSIRSRKSKQDVAAANKKIKNSSEKLLPNNNNNNNNNNNDNNDH